MAFLDMLGVASILPFMAVLVSPDVVHSNLVINKAFTISRHLGIQTVDQFLFALGVLTFLLLLTALIFKALTSYTQTRFVLMSEYSISRRLVEAYLNQPYSWFLNSHSADLGKSILSEVGTVVRGGLAPLMTLTSQTSVTLAILILLVSVDPLLAVGVGASLGLAYSGIFLITNGWLKKLGQARIDANRQRFTVVSEAFGAVKEIKARGLERIYIERFAKPARIYAEGQATAQVIAQLPRYFLEAVAFGGMLLVILYLMAQNGNFDDALPVISLYAFAGYRLMPALQQIYGSVVQLRFVSAAILTLENELVGLETVNTQCGEEGAVQFTRSIQLSQVTYSYPTAPKPTLKGVDLTISARSKVGLVGTTGSGKTTIVDIILGLLEPQEGWLSVDGHAITAINRCQWQRMIGYVPQQIYLMDDDVAANIAFGVSSKNVDQIAIERAAKIANLHEFVINELPQGYATNIGERGVRLSGGQRQRIGIARALYHNPKVLILDEATSALDNITEQSVVAALNELDHDMTVIIIAHRLSTVRDCDEIYFFERGRITISGTFDQLLSQSQDFAAMVLSEKSLRE